MNSDGVACTALKVGESGLSSCRVTELQEGLFTSLGTIDHSSAVEAPRSRA